MGHSSVALTHDLMVGDVQRGVNCGCNALAPVRGGKRNESSNGAKGVGNIAPDTDESITLRDAGDGPVSSQCATAYLSCMVSSFPPSCGVYVPHG